jgi:hypothetical protein
MPRLPAGRPQGINLAGLRHQCVKSVLKRGTLAKSPGCAIELTGEAARAAFVAKAFGRNHAGFPTRCAEFWVMMRNQPGIKVCFSFARMRHL